MEGGNRAATEETAPMVAFGHVAKFDRGHATIISAGIYYLCDRFVRVAASVSTTVSREQYGHITVSKGCSRGRSGCRTVMQPRVGITENDRPTDISIDQSVLEFIMLGTNVREPIVEPCVEPCSRRFDWDGGDLYRQQDSR